ncbi:hypothetical protein WKR98_16245 [Pigmentiphaga sp. YJ18]|uniref:hypothetical protein n=1 Tax=Pigmentiphaga sp. YJ18 TaxID=3134907 RepID=UPI003115AA89
MFRGLALYALASLLCLASALPLLGAFFPLYFLAKGWEGAGYGPTCFGLGFDLTEANRSF